MLLLDRGVLYGVRTPCLSVCSGVRPCVTVSNRAFTCDSGATDVPELQRASAGHLFIASVAAACKYLLRRSVDVRAVLRGIGSALQQDHFI